VHKIQKQLSYQTFSKIPPSSREDYYGPIDHLCPLTRLDIQQQTHSFKDLTTILLGVLRFLRSSIQNQKALAVVRGFPFPQSGCSALHVTWLCSCTSDNAVATDPKEKPKVPMREHYDSKEGMELGTQSLMMLTR
jgi:hypothetical protein